MRGIDLFAGAGGFSIGAEAAGVRMVWAANHWAAAVGVHRANFPHVHHACQDLHQADWTQVPPHDVLLASPACQGHSLARGQDRPHHDTARSSAWAVVSAAEIHRPAAVVVENVPEFADWMLFSAWCLALEQLGYGLSTQVLDAADCGVPQHRRRLFVVGVRGSTPMWLTAPAVDHVPVSRIVDFECGDWSPVRLKCPATRRRVLAGRRDHGDRFLVGYYGSARGGRSIHRPCGTITTRDRWAVVHGDQMRMLSTTEVRMCMGFPDTFLLPKQRALSIHLLGNAVPPPLAEWVVGQVVRRI